MRAVIGHVLAFGLNRIPQGPIECALAAYFLDFRLPMPREAEMFYWLYPYSDQALVRDALCADTRIKISEGVVFKLLKFYPIAFMITWKRPEAYDSDQRSFNIFRQPGIEGSAQIVFDRGPLPMQRWPEAPVHDFQVTLHGRDAMYARARKR